MMPQSPLAPENPEVSSVDLRQSLLLLHEPIPELREILGEVSAPDAAANIRMMHLLFREDIPLVPELAEMLADLIVEYAIPLKKRQQAAMEAASGRSRAKSRTHSRLQREAIRAFLEYNPDATNRYGELGEVLAFGLAIEMLGAPQIAAKLALKTSGNMPVHGTDGIHAAMGEDGSLKVYFLESKLAPNANHAAKEFCKSAAKAVADRKSYLNELRIAHDLSNLDSLQEPARSQLLDYLAVYGTSESRNRVERQCASLVYEEKEYVKAAVTDDGRVNLNAEAKFRELYEALHQHHEECIVKHAKDSSVPLEKCVVFFVAVPDLEALKKLFAGNLSHEHVRS